MLIFDIYEILKVYWLLFTINRLDELVVVVVEIGIVVVAISAVIVSSSVVSSVVELSCERATLTSKININNRFSKNNFFSNIFMLSSLLIMKQKWKYCRHIYCIYTTSWVTYSILLSKDYSGTEIFSSERYQWSSYFGDIR